MTKVRIAARTITPQASATYLFAPRVYNRRSRQRFTTARTHELIHHLGRAPTVPERIIISRVIAIEFELRRLDDKIADGIELSDHAQRGRLAAENRLRLDLTALGMMLPTKVAVSSLAAMRKAAANRSAAA